MAEMDFMKLQYLENFVSVQIKALEAIQEMIDYHKDFLKEADDAEKAKRAEAAKKAAADRKTKKDKAKKDEEEPVEKPPCECDAKKPVSPLTKKASAKAEEKPAEPAQRKSLLSILNGMKKTDKPAAGAKSTAQSASHRAINKTKANG